MPIVMFLLFLASLWVMFGRKVAAPTAFTIVILYVMTHGEAWIPR
jgi:hypothetical protein